MFVCVSKINQDAKRAQFRFDLKVRFQEVEAQQLAQVQLSFLRCRATIFLHVFETAAKQLLGPLLFRIRGFRRLGIFFWLRALLGINFCQSCYRNLLFRANMAAFFQPHFSWPQLITTAFIPLNFFLSLLTERRTISPDSNLSCV